MKDIIIVVVIVWSRMQVFNVVGDVMEVGSVVRWWLHTRMKPGIKEKMRKNELLYHIKSETKVHAQINTQTHSFFLIFNGV